jgi:hypothetical protein
MNDPPHFEKWIRSFLEHADPAFRPVQKEVLHGELWRKIGSGYAETASTGIAEISWPGPVSQTGYDPPHHSGILELIFVGLYDMKMEVFEAQKGLVMIEGVVHDPDMTPLSWSVVGAVFKTLLGVSPPPPGHPPGCDDASEGNTYIIAMHRGGRGDRHCPLSYYGFWFLQKNSDSTL